ncbi:MAG: preprotein translocase subunit SecG [Pyrinomonadaceae bacterium]
MLFTYVLYGLFILSCIVLVVAVLLQPGKADAGALFASSVSSTAFGPRGTATLLAKITIGAAAAFMLIALTLSLPALVGTRSVLQTQPADATPSPTPQSSPATGTTPSPQASVEGNANAPAATTTASPAATAPQEQTSPAEKK